MSAAARSGGQKIPFLRTSNVYWDEIRLDSVDEMSISPTELQEKSLSSGDLLVCEGGEVGRAAIWHGQRAVMSFQNHVHRLRPRTPDVHPPFYVYFLQAAFTQLGLYDGAANRTTIPNLSRNKLAALDVPRPPLREQKAIARVLALLREALRASEVAAAFGDELKAATMQRLFTRGLHNEPQKDTVIGPMPDSWDVVEFSTVRKSLQYGTSERSSDFGHYPVLRIPNISAAGIDPTHLKFTDLQEEAATPYLLERGDLLFVRTNGAIDRLGTCAVFAGLPLHAMFASYLIRARLDLDRLTPSYASHFLGSQFGTRQFSARAIPASDGKFNLNMPAIDSLLLPLPKTTEEQDEIAAVIDAISAANALHLRKKQVVGELFLSLLNGLMSGSINVNDLDLGLLEDTA